ncbi:MAG: hypothetical protein GF365_05425 [Candidatus Buchananbacteria bacterium]|nr:hypothetical protein [Candidatus Buchananbacteria bacterium]
MDLKQKTIEYFFKQYKITDPDLKAKILPEVTDIIYDYNMLIVYYQKEGDDYKKKQIMRDINETEDKLDEIFKNFKK